jgi:hypothetical protein
MGKWTSAGMRAHGNISETPPWLKVSFWPEKAHRSHKMGGPIWTVSFARFSSRRRSIRVSIVVGVFFGVHHYVLVNAVILEQFLRQGDQSYSFSISL